MLVFLLSVLWGRRSCSHFLTSTLGSTPYQMSLLWSPCSSVRILIYSHQMDSGPDSRTLLQKPLAQSVYRYIRLYFKIQHTYLCRYVCMYEHIYIYTYSEREGERRRERERELDGDPITAGIRNHCSHNQVRKLSGSQALFSMAHTPKKAQTAKASPR